MTTATFKHIDPKSYPGKPWAKVDGPGQSFVMLDTPRTVNNLRGKESEFSTDNCGFAVYNAPAKEKEFVDDQAIRQGYYAEVEDLLKRELKGVSKVVMFDHTIRRRTKDSPRQPVQQVSLPKIMQLA
jgi:hypothetical protein